MGVVLTLTMILITGLAITRERERGTMENLLSMPTRPFEVLLGKIIPYILVGYIQVTLILLAAHYLFHVPMYGSLILLLVVTFMFIVANLAVGISLFDGRAEPASSDAVDIFLLLADDTALRFRVSFPGHADLGAVARQNVAEYSFPAHRPRHPPEGQRLRRRGRRNLADRPVHRCRHDGCRETVSADAGLTTGEIAQGLIYLLKMRLSTGAFERGRSALMRIAIENDWRSEVRRERKPYRRKSADGKESRVSLAEVLAERDAPAGGATGRIGRSLRFPSGTSPELQARRQGP